MATLHGVLNRVFKLDEKKTTIKTEVLAGITTFMAMSYIIFVNPSILEVTGIPKEAALAATIWAAVIGTTIIALWANFPVALAPGMGLNAFFAYYVCGAMGLHWTTALGATFISGIVFLLLTVTHLRQLILDAVPMSLKHAIVVAIGLFISFVGLKSAGLVVKHDATVVGLGDMTSPGPLLACFGLLLAGALSARKIPGSLILSILVTTVLGMVFGVTPAPTSLDNIISFNLPSLSATFLKLDIMGALQFGIVSIIFTFTFVELFDNMGTLISLTRKAGLMDDKGHVENLDRALTSDSIGTMISAALGTSTVCTYVESAAGVTQGGRTGLTGITVAILFLLALPFAPLVEFVPAFATAPALILVGSLMMSEVVHINFDDVTEYLPAFITIIMMPLSFSIANGFGFGFVSYALMKLFTGRAKEVSPAMWAISIIFFVNFALRQH